MRREVVALIINRNKYLISRIPDGEFTGQWEFPGGPANADATDFEAVQKAINAKLGVDIFPYITAKRLVYKSPDGTVALSLIKCSISDEAKRILAVNIPSQYIWINPIYAADFDFLPVTKKF